MRLLILGSTGLLGQYLAMQFPTADYTPILHGFSNSAEVCFDCSDKLEVLDQINSIQPDLIINLIGLTDVERCEREPEVATKLNITAIANVINAVRLKKAPTKVVHISTDHVYDRIGLSSESNINLVNTYARTKFLGEQVCTAPRSLIIRTNFFGKSKLPGRKSLSDWIIEKLEAGEKVRAFNDVYFNPLSIETLVKLIKISVIKDLKGIYNVSSKNGLSKYDFAKTLAKEMNYNPNQIESISIDQHLNLGAKRPKGMMMDCTKFEAATNLSMPELAVEIKTAANGYQL